VASKSNLSTSASRPITRKPLKTAISASKDDGDWAEF